MIWFRKPKIFKKNLNLKEKCEFNEILEKTFTFNNKIHSENKSSDLSRNMGTKVVYD